MNLSFARRPHLRHRWELVESATPGTYSRRCPDCGKYKLASKRAARARRTPPVRSTKDVPFPGHRG